MIVDRSRYECCRLNPPPFFFFLPLTLVRSLDVKEYFPASYVKAVESGGARGTWII
jgi:hypothetical protein